MLPSLSSFSFSISKNNSDANEIDLKIITIYKKLYKEYVDLKNKNDKKTLFKLNITKKEKDRLDNLEKIVDFMNKYAKLKKTFLSNIYKVVSNFDKNISPVINVPSLNNVVKNVFTMSGGKKKRMIKKKKSVTKKVKKSKKSSKRSRKD